MRYRTATLADVPLLARLNKALIDDEGHRNRMSVDELAQRMSGWLKGGEYEAIVFERDDEPLGYALFRRGEDRVYLRQFFVCREHRRAGVGRAAIVWLRENAWREAPRIRLDVLVNNAAGIAFWRSVGFADYCVTMELGRDP